MPKTLDGGPWDYLPVLNACIQIMLTIMIGFLAGRFRALEADVFVPQAVAFVFKVALPLHIMRGIGIVVDFYDDSFLWTYIGAFLILRVIALVVSIGMVLFKLGSGHTGIGQVAVNWLCLSWISTVILGVPISRAVFGDESVGLFLGLLAGISSFIFQLPFQLLLLECHVLEKEFLVDRNANNSRERSIEEGETQNSPEGPEGEQALPDSLSGADPTNNVANQEKETSAINSEAETEPNLLYLWAGFARRRDVWIRIGRKVIVNPLLCGIAMGFFLSLSTLGPTYLKPTSEQFVPGLGWIFSTCSWLGECVSPVTLIAMGVWMEHQGRNMFQLTPTAASLYMFSKLFVVPMLMVGLAKGLDLNDTAGRAAILIAALPISMASFALGSQYDIGQTILSANVALGTFLMLPTILLWNIALDAVDLYPVPDSQ